MQKIIGLLAIIMFTHINSETVPFKKNYVGEPYTLITKAFQTHHAWGLHTTIDLKNCDPNLIRSKETIERFIVELCNLIEMKRFGNPTIIHFGEDDVVAGYSMVQLIETSCISGHFANLTNNAYLDIFSCKLYDPYIAAEFTKNFFKAESFSLNILLRV